MNKQMQARQIQTSADEECKSRVTLSLRHLLSKDGKSKRERDEPNRRVSSGLSIQSVSNLALHILIRKLNEQQLCLYMSLEPSFEEEYQETASRCQLLYNLARKKMSLMHYLVTQ
ncbi:hypothetical protein FGO68_gene2735 [Halteria grandinella]|uniref:Uncharacterized protein n=1 Tax=Halteria grandinella TaxID=5974 RepID=A0A8J8P220_HALGN|nr:hypothetical protein FGO68_gene2735 [Halteria grandinella]